MNQTSPIYTEKNNCQDCYKCLRQCPVKAIKIFEGSASVIPEDCIFCGHCVQVCPVGAKKVRNDVSLLKSVIDQRKKVIACLAPSYLAEFSDISTSALVSALNMAGFSGVSETALGAELVSKQTLQWMNNQPNGIYISSCCTSLVQLIKQKYLHLTDKLIPVLSPMQAHAKFLKQLYGSDTYIAFFGPCIAKKTEIDELPDHTDFVLTFSDLRKLLDNRLPDWKSSESSEVKDFIPYPAGKGNYFPVDGGMIANLKKNPGITETSFMSFSGIQNVKEVLDGIYDWEINNRLFLELLVCEGGCIKGPAMTCDASIMQKRYKVLTSVNEYDSNNYHIRTILDLGNERYYNQNTGASEFTSQDIDEALRASGKFSIQDELNCSGCGYDSCRDFAKAMLEGKAERIMCVSYTRKVAQDKASILLKKIPYGVVIVDEQLKIIDSNQKFMEMFGSRAVYPDKIPDNSEGIDLSSMFFAYRLFSTVLHTGDEIIDRNVRGEGMFLNLSIVTIQPHKIVCGIIQNMQEPEVNKEMIHRSVKDVIRQNTEVVQKIAFLLGENASYTQSVLNTIFESSNHNSH